jgi:PHD/YefM family antitoxin component YafN of YafNO toxin-antitoxin module
MEDKDMPVIMPIRDLRNTSEISELAHKKQEPIFITKNGYSDLVVMSCELYEKIVRENKIDQAIEEAEREVRGPVCDLLSEKAGGERTGFHAVWRAVVPFVLPERDPEG